MQTLILEDDPLMLELLISVTQGLGQSVEVHSTDRSDKAIAIWWRESIDLVLCDWQLEVQDTAEELIKAVRADSESVPILLITGHNNRDLVRRGMKLGVTDFIAKPFAPDQLADRIKRLMPVADQSGLPPESLDVWLKDHQDAVETLPALADVSQLIGDPDQTRAQSPRELAKRWRGHVNIAARLIRIANRSRLHATGEPITSLLDAIQFMGVDMAVTQVSALALSHTGDESGDAMLTERAQSLNTRSVRIAECAAQLASESNADVRLSFNAGLLSHLGDLAVIKALQYYVSAYGPISEAAMEQALDRFSSAYGNRLKVVWQLPIQLRQMAGAVHELPAGTVSRSLILMQLARRIADGQKDTPEAHKLGRQIGIKEAAIQQVNPNV